jgi:Fe-S-cluster containining protein
MATAPAAEPSQQPCATCGACCRDYVVPVFGHDVWRISTGQRLSPEHFVVAYPQKAAALDGFLLEAGGVSFSLALDKRGPFKAGRSCVFLVELVGGHARCGIYAQRPVVCRAYPMTIWSGVVAQRPESLCPPDSWPLAAVLRPAWRSALQRLRLQWDIYGEVVARWNARVAAASTHRSFALPEFLSYLINVYDRLAALERELGEATMTEVEATWPNVPRAPLDPRLLAADAAALPWLGYFSRARQVIDTYYPDIPPQPPRMLATHEAQPPPNGAAMRPENPAPDGTSDARVTHE